MVRRLAEGEQPITLEEYERLPEDPHHRYEVVRGLLVREPIPGGPHGWLEARLTHLLYAFVEAHGLGTVFATTGYILEREPLTLRGPDISFISREKLPGGYPEDGFFTRAPDLAVEIVSPSNRKRDLQEKAHQFVGAGTQVVWIVDPKRRTVSVITPALETRLDDGDVLDGGAVLPGFRVPLTRLFAH